MRNLRIGEETRGDNTVARRAISTREFVSNGSEIVQRDVGKLRTARALADGPDTSRGRLQAIVHLYITSLIQINASYFQPNSCGVGCAPGSNRDIAARNCPFAV